MSARFVGVFALIAGLGLLTLFVPLVGRAPLYDGVVVTEPYRFLAPDKGEAGGPTSSSDVFDVFGGQSPILSAGTGESPPQASVFGNEGDLVVGPSTTAITIDINPIEPPGPPSGGTLAGNVYDVSVTDQAGTPVVPTVGGGFSVVLRQPEDISGKATMALFVDGEWRFVQSSDAGLRGFYVATPPELGIFALILGGGHLPTLPPFSPPTPVATAVATPSSSELPTTAQATTIVTTSTQGTNGASFAPAGQPTPTPAPTQPTSSSEPSTSLAVAALLVLIAIAVVVALIVARRLPRRR